jgi:small subunit ribosomal protein S4
MARDINASCRKCRRAGEKLFLKGDRCGGLKCAIVRKNYAPGVHGKKFSRGTSEYGKQLAMKQKIKRIYGVLERQFRKHFDQANKHHGITGDLLMTRLEMRLDNVVYRMGFGNSRKQSRQLVNHGLFNVNGKKVDISSFEVKVGDVVSVRESKKDNEYFKKQSEILKNKKDFPSWIIFDETKLEGKISAVPKGDELEIGVDPQMVVEYYSR